MQKNKNKNQQQQKKTQSPIPVSGNLETEWVIDFFFKIHSTYLQLLHLLFFLPFLTINVYRKIAAFKEFWFIFSL